MAWQFPIPISNQAWQMTIRHPSSLDLLNSAVRLFAEPLAARSHAYFRIRRRTFRALQLLQNSLAFFTDNREVRLLPSPALPLVLQSGKSALQKSCGSFQCVTLLNWRPSNLQLLLQRRRFPFPSIHLPEYAH